MFFVAQLNSNSSIKGPHVYVYKYTVNKELTCAIDDNNKHSINAIKFLFCHDGKKINKFNVTKDQLVVHVPEQSAKILHIMVKK